MDQDHEVYDKEHEGQAATRPDLPGLRAQEGIGSKTVKKALGGGPEQPGSDAVPGPGNSMTPGGIEAAEKAAAVTGMGGGFFKMGNSAGRMDRLNALVNRNKKKGLIGGGAMGVIVSLFLLAFFFLIPLKIENIVQNLQNRFSSSAENAIETQTERMLERYMVDHVLPDYKACGSTISKNCSAKIVGNGKNPVTNMYNAWAHAKLENKLAADYGIEFKFDPHSNTWHLKAPGTSGAGDNIGPNGERLAGEFERSDRAAMRGAVRKAMEGETYWKQMYYRFKVGRLLEVKYGIKRCIIYCGKADALAGKVSDKKIAAKLYLVQRVVTPRNQTLGIALECLIKGCAVTNVEPSDDPALQGAPENPDTDAAARQALTELASQYGNVDAEELLKVYKDISEKGLQKYLTTKALTPIIGEVAAGRAGNAIPIVGWMNLAAQVVNFGNDSGPTIKKLSYVTNASAAVSLFMMYRSYADEIHTGHADATELGSMTDSLGPGDNGTASDPQVGGTAGAEQAPLYAALMGGDEPSASSSKTADGGLLFGKAFALTDPGSYKCKNGKGVPSGQYVCDEELLGGGNGIANTIHDAINAPPLVALVPIAQVWRATIGQVFNIAGGLAGDLMQALTYVPNKSCDIGVPSPYCAAKSATEKALPEILDAATQYLIPNPFGLNMSGGRNFDMMAAGAGVQGKDGCDLIGCRKSTTKEAAAVINEQQAEAQTQFANESLFARMFDTSSSYSMVSKLAMATPLDLQSSAQTTMASVMSNPFGSLASSFGNLFSGQKAFAATPATADTADPFKIGTSVFPESDIPKNAEQYWDQHCSDDATHAYQNDADYNNPATNYNQNITISEDTSMPEHNVDNPCLLIKHTTGAAAGAYDTSLLTDDEQEVLNASNDSGSTDTNSSDNTLPTGSAKQLATQLKPYIADGKIKCLTAGCPDIVNTANGQSIKNSSCYVDALDPQVLGMLLKLVQKGHTFILSALCTDHPSNPDSLHHQGKAADFNTIDGVFIGPDDVAWDSAKVEAGKKLDQDIVSFMPKGSVGFGQIQCHAAFDFFSGYDVFDDLCHHQHVQVED